MKKRILFTVMLIVFSLASLWSQEVKENFWDGVIYFKIEDNSNIVLPEFSAFEQAERIYKDYPEILNLVSEYSVKEVIRPFKTPCPKVQKTYRLKFNHHDMVDELIRDISIIDYIEYAELSPIYKQMIIPNDEMVSDQYYLESVNAYEAWEVAENNYRVTLAVVDDAVDIDHPDLVGNIWTNPNEVEDGTDTDGNGFIDDIHGWNAADDNNDPRPSGLLSALMFHGTHVAGIAGAVANNDIGIAGVSNNNVYVIGVRSTSMAIALTNPVEGVDYAVAAGAEVVNMSFGGNQEGFIALQNIINAGVENGTIFIAAAGNDGTEEITYPAGWDDVIAVGASDQDDNLWVESQRGEFVDLLAPGVNIMSLMPNEGYSAQSGTSMASPLVAGAVALLKSHKPDATNQEIIDCLLEGCDNIDDINPDFIGKMGAGRMNIYNSIMCLGVEDPHLLTVLVEPEGAGEITGAGEYNFESDVFVSAIANDNFKFTAWTDPNQQILSMDAEYSFEMPDNDLVIIANFMDISNINSEKTFTPEVYPNPFSDVLNVDNQDQIERIKINTITGHTVLDVKVTSNGNINTSNLPSGFYIIEIESKSGQRITQKIIKH